MGSVQWLNGTLLDFCTGVVAKTPTVEPPHFVRNASDRPSAAMVWGVGLSFVTIISLCAAVGIALMPLLSRRLYYRILTYFVGLGVGSLSGSAIFHLIPQAFSLVGDGTKHEYLDKAWVIVGGVYLFFFVDKFLQLIMKMRKTKKKPAKLSLEKKDSNEKEDSNGTQNRSSLPLIRNGTTQSSIQTSDLEATLAVVAGESGLRRESSEGQDMVGQAHGMCAHEHPTKFGAEDSVIATVAWMVIFGDGLHNFIDGLSIGAAFSDSILSGVSISVAVLAEEFPHELGDVAILISAGMTLRQALVYNLLSAATCYLGFVIGVLLGELAEAQVYIFALAGGMFLYISLGSMVPEMNNTVEAQLAKGPMRGLRCILLQGAGVLTGLVLMFLMSYYGSLIQFG